jgi:hypothetical protein
VRIRIVPILALVLAGCGSPSSTPLQPPSEAAAAGYLRTVVGIVLSGDLTTLCERGSGTCQQTLQGIDPATVPHTEPVVTGTRVIAPSPGPDGAWSVGGRVLELCGRDGRNQAYSSEMLVFGPEDQLISTGTVFWLGIMIAEDPIAGSSPEARPPCPLP